MHAGLKALQLEWLTRLHLENAGAPPHLLVVTRNCAWAYWFGQTKAGTLVPVVHHYRIRALLATVLLYCISEYGTISQLPLVQLHLLLEVPSYPKLLQSSLEIAS